MWTFPELLDIDPREEEEVVEDEDEEENGEGMEGEGEEISEDEEAEAAEDDEVDRDDGDGDENMEEAVETGQAYQLRGKSKVKETQAVQVRKRATVVARSKTGNSTDRVHCARQVAYWRGMIQLIQTYWMGFKVSVWVVWINKWQYAVSTHTSLYLIRKY